ncbi:hypothetical protein Sps_02880 [Shewanella psychrophila]|uniref:Pilus assembly protein E-set like domain-containing protein n=1 Tax=Shewanella psychrophila TaxID=225848 RepID=A0A1S6HRA4_9GAMM|nr:TcfC E-set like domain-containing protein [Shewanella psychrophila]AQS38028.1 hypothetical protein Sps_02880 [Shewanella psychrophila]
MLKYYFFLLLLLTGTAHSQYIPKGFQHFYEYEERTVLFTLPNNNYYETKVYANYYSISRIENVKSFYEALTKSGIKNDRVEEVVAAILSNDVNQGGIQSLYSYEDNKLQLDVSSDFMSESKGKVNYTQISPDPSAIIVNNRLYTSYYDNDFNSTLNNGTIIGLGKGYLETDVSLFSSTKGHESTDFDVNNLKYEFNFEGHSLQLGYSSYNLVKNNSTSLLDFSRSKNSYYLSLSSSDNLLAINDSQQKQLYFDIKNSGTIDVIRDGKTLFSQSYPKGQHSISYAKLPRGNYDVELRIRADGYAEERIIRRISNNISKTSHKGYDYNVSLRQSEYDTEQDVETLAYAEVSITKSLFNDTLLLGSNSRSDGDSIDVGAAAIYSDPNLSAAIYYNKLPSGIFYQTSLSLFGLNLDYEYLNVNGIGPTNNLVSAVYGQQSYDQLILSYSFPIANGSVSIYGSKLHRDAREFNNYNSSLHHNYFMYDDTYNTAMDSHDGYLAQDSSEYYTGKIDSTNLAVNYQTNILNNISLNVGYSLSMSDQVINKRDGIFSLNISIPLGNDHLSYSGGYESSNRSSGRVTNTVSYHENELGLFSSVDSSGGTSLSNYLDGEQSETSLNGNISLNSEQFYASGYGNYSSQGNSNLSMTLESTSIISGEGIYQSKYFNDSYIIVNSNNFLDDIDEDENTGVLGLQVNNGRYVDKNITGKTTLIGLDYFKSYEINLDNEISGYSSRDREKYKTDIMFSYPGSVHTISSDVEEVTSFLSYFEDFNNKSLNNIQCLGEACVSVSKVGDGIYSISLIRDQSFKIVSNDQFCFVGPEGEKGHQAKIKCFPTIETTDDGMQLVSSGLGKQGDFIYYLGELDEDIPDRIIKGLKKANIEYIEYEFAQETHLFVKLKSKSKSKSKRTLISLVQMNIINELQSYVSNDSENNSFALK